MTSPLKGLALSSALLAAPAMADWKPASLQVMEATKDPRVAAVLKEVDLIDAAIVAGDKEGFVRAFADDAIVNSPFNNVTTKAMAAARYQSGVLTYKYLHRSIEYAGLRRDDEVVLMGEETCEPPAGNMFAGKTVRRRFTDVWRLQGGRWLLSLRQATVFEVK
ncbi:nuclear transport factor 2 family protein (plasmid) [Polymorphobacter sp. PAMC 29334]|uniref:nuclear transport factor 2 family protein n=1 Tax=Polymorphobacter sp. PAMC 29334 TaxID=2862331 RepID=UPI001C68071F|nr:nuclear transport factor 2 family protein [Polymorphobacter sp. PAMC 29334]QYE37050.1 nuclear transport factor 2 family protein [Polymorphobacter sp. PAMC 29334]